MRTTPTAKRIYTARADRDENGVWAIKIVEFPNVLTQAKRLAQVEGLAREAIDLAISVGIIPDETYAVVVEKHVFGLEAQVAKAVELRHVANEAVTSSTTATVHAARALAEKGLTMRDIGDMLEISFQRAQQLVH